MKKFATIISLFTISISLTFCAMKQELQSEFPQEIHSVFYQKIELSNKEDGIHFYIEFKKPLAPTIKLEKIYFQKQSAAVVEITTSAFVAHFKDRNKKHDFILDSNSAKEYGNKAPIIEKSKFELKSNEAVVEFKNNNKTQFFKITNITEKRTK
ncbi:hypothetical protein LNP27_03680 [Flavobacterium galactosidilyticum]|uniref:hypothetical protein n=1 Tax=Flavobacterium galactosidilyticum TaxID=2893886 RepID=UPI001E29C056|nr:hypothetical protein [Flavobacterium sp. F-340]UFH47141.1 hypothetical protein LNP27_03680 [Flavobacterium sp. F-340]